MIKRFLALMTLLTFVAGCSNAVHYTVSDQYRHVRPYTIAVLPVVWSGGDKGDNDIAYFFRTIAVEKLRIMNYSAIPLEEIDEKYLKLGSAWFASRPAPEIAKLFNADAVLFIHITEWNRSMFATYASLKVNAGFELYSGNGLLLWSADYRTKESDLRLDRKSMEYAIIKAYEPKVQRFMDAVFATLPKGEAPKKTQTFFQWLP